MRPPIRLIDLYCPWPLQYARESTQYDPADYPEIDGRLGQIEGYLGGTAAAIVPLFRRDADWARQADPWATLAAMVARVEAEFCGRLLADAADAARWRDDRDGLCWACLGLPAVAALFRSPADLGRIPALFERGVRVFQLAGTPRPADDPEGLTDLQRGLIDGLLALAQPDRGPRPALDLAGLGSRAIEQALDWYEAEPTRAARLVPLHTRGPIDDSPRRRLRALGGLVGIGLGTPDAGSAEALAERINAIAAEAPASPGIAIATGFLNLHQPLNGLGNAEAVAAWALRSFDRPLAEELLQRAGTRLLTRLTGCDLASGPGPVPA